MFSIVIPLYNKEEYIASTLSSVLNQSFKDFEVIIVNDGSTDRSVEVVKEFDDSRIRLIDQPNAGVSAARNRGVKEAKYDWIAFLDADDKWEVTFLEEITSAIKRYPNNNIFVGGQMLYSNSTWYRYDNEFIPQDGKVEEVNYYEVISKYDSPIHSSNVVIRKQHLKEHGLFPVGRKNYEDHDLWIRLCINDSVTYINKKLSSYTKDDPNRASAGVFSSNDFISFIQTFIDVKNQLSSIEKAYFKKYYNRFIFLTFIAFKQYYTRKEISEIRSVSDNLLVFPYRLYIDIIINFNIKRKHIIEAGRFLKKIKILK